jgi:hypothetical protein
VDPQCLTCFMSSFWGLEFWVALRCSEYFCTAGLNSKRSTLLSMSCCALVVHGIYNCSLITIKRCLHRWVAHVVVMKTRHMVSNLNHVVSDSHNPSLSISPFSFLSSFLSWCFCVLQIYRTPWYIVGMPTFEMRYGLALQCCPHNSECKRYITTDLFQVT